MTILLAALAVAFAALCVWLTVRVVNRRERWAKWTLAGMLIGLPVLYVASYGPIAGLYNRGFLSYRSMHTVDALYGPLIWVYMNGPEPVSDAILWWANLWSY